MQKRDTVGCIKSFARITVWQQTIQRYYVYTTSSLTAMFATRHTWYVFIQPGVMYMSTTIYACNVSVDWY